jgi:PAS domain S-box-containing protein
VSLIEAIQVLAEEHPLAVVVTDGELSEPGPRILYVNRAFERMTGYTAEEVLGRSPRMLQGERTSLAARKALRRALRAAEPHTTTLVNYRKSGEPYHCQIAVYPVCDPAGRLINAIAIEREVKRGPGRPARKTERAADL